MMKMLYPAISRMDEIKKMKFPSELSSSLSELVGIHIGDGHLAYHDGQWEYVFQICGHQIKDKIYYDTVIRPLLKDLFNIDKKPQFFPSKTYGYQIYSKGLVNFMLNNFNLPDGKKTHTIRIPDIFFNHKNFLKDCLRGIIDTDFYMSFGGDRGDRPVLGAWFASRNLVLDLHKAFEMLGIESRIRLDDFYVDKRTNKKYIRHYVRISKKGEIHKYFKNIGTHHPLFKCKYYHWNRGIYLMDKNVLNNPRILTRFAPKYCSSNCKQLRQA